MEAGKFLVVRWIFAQISPKLPEKLLCDFFQHIFSHKDHEEVLPPKQGLHMSFCFSANVGGYFCPDFQGFCPDFRQIKTLWVRLPCTPASDTSASIVPLKCNNSSAVSAKPAEVQLTSGNSYTCYYYLANLQYHGDNLVV